MSENGLKVNDQLIRRHHGYTKLESRDVITIGNVVLTFWLPLAVWFFYVTLSNPKSAKKNEKRKNQRISAAEKKRKRVEAESGVPAAPCVYP